jgi:hypothetical protein
MIFTLERICALEGSSKRLFGRFAELSSESSLLQSKVPIQTHMNMHSMVIAVYRKKNPLRPGDAMIWHRDVGLMVPITSLSHGHVFWALTLGRENKARVEMRFCETIGEIVFREKFVKKKSQYKPWSVVEKSIRDFFKGPKPDSISWKQAKVRMKKAREVPSESWPSLREHRAGTALLNKAPAFLHV